LRATEAALEQPVEDTPERIASVYRERAKRLVRPAVPSDAGSAGAPMLVFRLDEGRYGIELADVSAILGATRYTQVPDSEAKLEGLINVNGTIRPILNLRFFLHLPVSGKDTSAYFLLLRQKQRELCLRVDEVEFEHRMSLPNLHIPRKDPVTRGISDFTSGTLTVLDTSALFSEFWNERSEP